MNTTRSFILFASAVALGLTACSSASGESPESGAETAAVEIADSQFQPQDIEVASGTSITWTNVDDVPHTVTFDDSPVVSSDELGDGDSFTATFDDPGTFSYVCALHPEMSATVTVAG